MTKQEAREQMKKLRRELSDQERKKKDRLIFEHLMQTEAMQQETYFFPFVSYGTEVDTLSIIEWVLEQGRMTVAVPKVQGKEMDFYRITSQKELAKGYQGILEPVTSDSIFAKEGVMLLPGLAFDKKKNRTGYGGGYYDRYLARCKSQKLITIALAYEFQIVDAIEADCFDIRPQWIITENGIF